MEKKDQKSRVVALYCEDYEEEKVYRLLRTGLELVAGSVEGCGLSGLIKKEEKILLKPNLLKKAEVERAVITHPVVVGAFARILREAGYENIVLADSCGHGSTRQVIQGTGMDVYLEKYGIPAIDYMKGVRVDYPQGKQAKEFILPEELLDADCVISLSKMKTHALERITGAVKNSYGFIYGKNKAIGHTKYPSADSFARMLIDLNQFVKPRLYIMDGITAMEGNGPGSGDPVSMNLILLSTDPVALDSVFARLVYLKPEMVPTNYHGEKMGLGTCKEEKIEIYLVTDAEETESLNRENVNREAANSENVNREATNSENVNREAANSENVNREAVNSEVVNREAVNQEAAKQEIVNQEAAKQEVVNQEVRNREGWNPEVQLISVAELVERYGNPDFNVDRSQMRNNIWTRLAKALNLFQKKPYIEPDKCVRCGICVNSCPVPGKAVDFRNGKGQPPVYDYKKCIRCFCCQEMCPKKAIKVR